MAKRTLTVETPFGIFTRKTATAYRFAAVAEQRDRPERGVSLAGNTKGDPELSPEIRRFIALNGQERIIRDERARYHVVWSSTEAGARKNAEGYFYDSLRVLGVYPVRED